MNENIDLTKILKNCPKGTKLYSPICGEVYFIKIDSDYKYSIITNSKYSCTATFTKEGHHYDSADGECLLFPSKEQRDWNKFSAPWYKKEKFDPKTLKPFDRVLVRDVIIDYWTCGFFSHIVTFDDVDRYNVGGILYDTCIPYNDDTKHLTGTKNDAPEFYKYWEE